MLGPPSCGSPRHPASELEARIGGVYHGVHSHSVKSPCTRVIFLPLTIFSISFLLEKGAGTTLRTGSDKLNGKMIEAEMQLDSEE